MNDKLKEEAKEIDIEIDKRQQSATEETTPVENPGKNEPAIETEQTNQTTDQPEEFIGDGIRFNDDDK